MNNLNKLYYERILRTRKRGDITQKRIRLRGRSLRMAKPVMIEPPILPNNRFKISKRVYLPDIKNTNHGLVNNLNKQSSPCYKTLSNINVKQKKHDHIIRSMLRATHRATHQPSRPPASCIKHLRRPHILSIIFN